MGNIAVQKRKRRHRGVPPFFCFLSCFCFERLYCKVVFVQNMLLVVILLLNDIFCIIFAFGSYGYLSLQNLGYGNDIFLIHYSPQLSSHVNLGLTLYITNRQFLSLHLKHRIITVKIIELTLKDFFVGLLFHLQGIDFL